jgi:hypothetical protein
LPFYLVGQDVKRLRLVHLVIATYHLETARAKALLVEACADEFPGALRGIGPEEQVGEAGLAFTVRSEHVTNPVCWLVEGVTD